MLVGLSDYVGVYGARRREEKPSPAERVKAIKAEMQKRGITADEIAAEMREDAIQVTNSLRAAARPERLDDIEAALFYVVKARKPAPKIEAEKKTDDPYDPKKWAALIEQAGFSSRKAFCDAHRMQTSTLTNIISGGKSPSPETRKKFIDAIEGRRKEEDIFNLGRVPKNAPAFIDKEYPPSSWRERVLAAGYQSYNQFCRQHRISASAFNRISGGWSAGNQDSHDKIIAAIKAAEQRKAEGLI